jgi:alkanesulfonate monooxygenase SsuD/methylene tetrahydromethanopterin reductase-like flavin-dependent oxidoreductase (luciferase family)
MQAHLLKGTKQQIAENLARMPGEVREAIVFVEEPASAAAQMPDREDLFAEMRLYMVDVEDLDDARDAVYRRAEGE